MFWAYESHGPELWRNLSLLTAYIVANLSQSTTRRTIYADDFNPYIKRSTARSFEAAFAARRAGGGRQPQT